MKETEIIIILKAPQQVDTSRYSKIRYVISKQYNVIVKAIYDKDNNKLKNLAIHLFQL